MISYRCRVFFAAVVFLAVSSFTFARKPDTGFLVSHVFPTRCHVLLPEDWSSNKKWPIILFRHRADERGADGLDANSGRHWHRGPQSRTRFAAIIVMPQCKTNSC